MSSTIPLVTAVSLFPTLIREKCTSPSADLIFSQLQCTFTAEAQTSLAESSDFVQNKKYFYHRNYLAYVDPCKIALSSSSLTLLKIV